MNFKVWVKVLTSVADVHWFCWLNWLPVAVAGDTLCHMTYLSRVAVAALQHPTVGGGCSCLSWVLLSSTVQRDHQLLAVTRCLMCHTLAPHRLQTRHVLLTCMDSSKYPKASLLGPARVGLVVMHMGILA